MQVQDLKNYGCSLTQTAELIPPETIKMIRKRSMAAMRQQLGLLGMARFVLALRGTRKRLMQHDYVVAREHGLTHQGFLESRIQNAAMFAALAQIVGEDRALTIQMEMTESLSLELMSLKEIVK